MAHPPDDEAPEAIPVDLVDGGILDLHAFAPSDVKALVAEYVEACLERGILDVRLIHGKGNGTIRRIVHAALDRHPEVERYALAGEDQGGWGATVVRLRPR